MTIEEFLDKLGKEFHQFDEGQEDGFELLNTDGQDCCVRHDWIDLFPDLKDRWYKFMSGQTACTLGVFDRDVCKFLRVVQNEYRATSESQGDN